MTQEQIHYVIWCIQHDVHKFYTWAAWLHVRREALELDHNECVRCRERGRHTRAKVVHHVNHLRAHPELALELWYVDRKGVRRRQLISLCDNCHEAEHNYRMPDREEITPELW